MSPHLAAILTAQGEPFEVHTRTTPKPGPGELIVAVKCVALNPADGIIRDTGLFVQQYPTVIGFDLAGLVLEVGDDVPSSIFRPGVTRVAAYAAFVWKSSNPDYGAFQEKCIVPWQHAVPLPKTDISWIEAATLPVAFQVPLHAWDAIGIPRIDETAASKAKTEALLIWGASSSVGTGGVQTARLLRDEPRSSIAAVYATASAANHEYIRSLGADQVFDYKDPEIVEALISAARVNGLSIRHCFLAMGQLSVCQEVLKAFIVDGQEGEGGKAVIASAPPIPANTAQAPGIEIKFLNPSMVDHERLAQFEYWMSAPQKGLANRTVRPAPSPHVVGKSLGAIDAGITLLARGVSCTKLVIEIAK